MGGVLARGVLLTCVGIGMCGAACSADRNDAREHVASTRQATHETVIRGTSQKVCQLVGDTDYETGLPTRSQSFSEFGVNDTDTGFPVTQGDRTWFFFGDVGSADDIDPLGFTDEKPDRSDKPSCPKLNFTVPERNAEKQAVTLRCGNPALSGPLRRGANGFVDGFNVPNAAVFDPVKNRFIAHFVLGLGNGDKDPAKKMIVTLGEAPLSSPKDFTCIRTPLSDDPTHFSIIAPWIADVNELGYDKILPPHVGSGTGQQVLLAWGTGIPYRNTGVSLAAVRLDDMEKAGAWRFFNAKTNSWVDVLPPGTDNEVASHGIAGELSVSFDPDLREWRMVHGTTAPALDAGERGQLPNLDFPVVIMRTSPRPEGEWSKAKLLFIRKKDGQPSWADDGEGLFIHRGNQRAWRPADKLVALPGDGPNTMDPPDAAAGPLTCASTFPSYCTGRLVEDTLNPAVGCCTRSDRCCDFAFNQQLGPKPGSWQDGNLYAQYLIPSFTQSTWRPNERFPNQQRVFWV